MFNELIAFDRESARTFDKNGYMHVAACRLSKACVSPYRGREIDRWQDLGLQPDQIYQVYRPAEELAKAALSFHGMPLMDNHVPVSSSELEKTKIHQRLVGSIEGNVRMVGDYLVGDVVVWTDGAQDGIETKAQSDLSCGYRYDLDLKPGRAPSGQPYDMSMHTISANHVALVPDGRVPGAMIADAAPRISVAGALRECFAHQEAKKNPGASLASDALRECFASDETHGHFSGEFGELRGRTAKAASERADGHSSEAAKMSTSAGAHPNASTHAAASEAHYQAMSSHQDAQRANYRAGNSTKAAEHASKAEEHRGSYEEHRSLSRGTK